jgi:glucokinase
MKDNNLPTPVLEIGGTHVTAALVQGPEGGWQVQPGSLVRRHLEAHASADALLDEFAEAAKDLGRGHTGAWGVALPGPFDYDRGIARYADVGKFDHLQGVDVRAGLASRLGGAQQSMAFLNDADAFGIGEFVMGAAGDSSRAVCITLGTGVGSCFLAGGVPVKTGNDVPPDGSCYLLQYRGHPLEDTTSRRAIRRAYAAANPAAGTPDVHELAAAARTGDALAAAVLEHAFTAVGEAVGPYLSRFGAGILIVGGSMAGSWDIVERAIRKGLSVAAPALSALPITRAQQSEVAGLIGAAYWAATLAGSEVSVPRT